MENLLMLPLVLPVLAAIVSLFAKNSLNFRKVSGVFFTLAQFVVAIMILVKVYRDGIQVLQVGSWAAPFGITLVADMFSAIMLFFAGLIGFTVSVYALGMMDERRLKFHFYLLFNILLLGVNGAFITGDVFNLYVWFEVMLISSFVLVTLGGERKQLEGAVKYVTINMVSSMLFLAAAGLLYGKMGTLNMADLAVKLQNTSSSNLVNSSAMLFFIAFGIKAAVFPFFFWLPASYHTPPVAVTALFAGLLTKVGVYAMIRFFTLFFIPLGGIWKELFLVTGGLTMLIGVFTAASQYDIRRILSFHIISQIGYMIMGLGFFTPLGIAGAIYYMGHNIVAKTNTFMVGGMVSKLKGTFELKSIGGLYKTHPYLALLFVVPAFALAGVPPLSGFFGKFILVKAGFDSHHFLVTAISLFVGLITLFSMIKIWNEGFWKKQPEDAEEVITYQEKKLGFAMIFPSVVLALFSIGMGVAVGFFFDLCMTAAHQLLEPSSYIKAVLGN
ncbi:Na+/H+ antiporter subunit D [Prolixibacter sp. SD074]|uniref:Na+/H+ antiporter subunit D n=1 Tax=Prolixibacter sp. SD074 TaxID=2652391 RepID=UPI00127F6943|nr:Na+/H+ antiporter subunit D [Prolixibacter sp. SD074]GET30541.1 cation:proton antiporter [Prolixibacter sp. SD074]